MRTMGWAAAGMIGIWAAAHRPVEASRPGADGPLERIGWMAGCFEQRAGERLIEEHRMGLRGGAMPGMGRTTSAGKLVEYEFTLIREREGKLVYEAQPGGGPATIFEATAVDGDSVVFAAPAHDFPQVVGYRRAGADSVVAWVGGTIQGKARRIEFPYRRVPCTPGTG